MEEQHEGQKQVEILKGIQKKFSKKKTKRGLVITNENHLFKIGTHSRVLKNKHKLFE